MKRLEKDLQALDVRPHQGDLQLPINHSPDGLDSFSFPMPRRWQMRCTVLTRTRKERRMKKRIFAWLVAKPSARQNSKLSSATANRFRTAKVV